MSLYERAGVKEFWIVYPEGRTVMVFILQNESRYGRPEAYTDKDEIKPSIFGDLSIVLSTVFKHTTGDNEHTGDEQ